MRRLRTLILVAIAIIYTGITVSTAQAADTVKLSIKDTGLHDATLTWNLPDVDNGITYTLENTTLGKAYSVDYPNRTMTDTRLDSGGIYEYRLKLTDPDGSISFSNEVTLRTLSNINQKEIVSSEPANIDVNAFSVLSATPSSVTLQWGGGKDTKLFKVMKNGDMYSAIKMEARTTDQNEAYQYTFKGLQQGGNYSFSVTPVSSDNKEGNRSTITYVVPNANFAGQVLQDSHSRTQSIKAEPEISSQSAKTVVSTVSNGNVFVKMLGYANFKMALIALITLGFIVASCIIVALWKMRSKREQSTFAKPFKHKAIKTITLILLVHACYPASLASAATTSVSASITKISGGTNSAYVEFSVPLADADVLFQTGFESGEKRLDLNWHGTGNQAYVSSGHNSSTALQLMDNITTRKGNYYDTVGGQTDGVDSMAQYGITSIKSDSRLSLQYDLKTTGSLTNVLSFFGSLWKSKGEPVKDLSGRLLKFKQAATFTSSSAPTKIYVMTDDGTIDIPNGKIYTLLSSSYDDYKWGYMYYTYSSSDQSFNLRTDVMTQPTSVTVGGSNIPSTREGQAFAAGSNIIELSNFGDIAVYKEQNVNSDWTTFSSSFDLPTISYNPEKYGAQFYTRWQTNGLALLDNIKIGYAEKAILYRNGIQVYAGYDSNYTDTGATDQNTPNEVPPESMTYSYQQANKQVAASWSAPTDRGTTYTYQIQGQLRDGSLDAVQGDKTATVTSGIKGYIVTTDNTFGTNITSGSISTTTTSYTFTPTENQQYIHIAAVDNNGNIGATSTMMMGDGDPPIIELTPSTTKPTNSDVTVNVNAYDEQMWVTSVTLPGNNVVNTGTSSFVADKNGTYTVTARDFFGNVTTKNITISNIDRSSPVITFSPDGRSWTPNTIDVGVTVTDNFPNAGLTTKYLVTSSKTIPDSSAEWKTAAQTTFNVQIPDQGEWYLIVKSTDQAGNVQTKVSNVFQIKALPSAIDAASITITSPTAHSIAIQVPAKLDISYDVTDSVGNVYTIPAGSMDLLINGLPSGTKQNYIITPKNESGYGPSTNVAMITRPEQVAFNEIKPVAGHDGSVTIDAYAVAGAEQYVFTLKGSTGNILQENTTTSPNIAYHLAPNNTYSVEVYAYNAGGNGLSTTRRFLTVPTISGLAITNVNEKEITLHWDTVTGDSYYNVQRNQEFLTVVGNTYDSVTTYTDNGLKPNTMYDYLVSASNIAGSSVFRSISAMTLPTAPNVTVTKIGSDSVQLDWEGQDSTIHAIYENGVLVDRVRGTRYQRTGLEHGTNYAYQVVAENQSGSGAATTLYVLTLPGKPIVHSIINYTPDGARVQMEPLQSVRNWEVVVNGKIFKNQVDNVIDLSGLEAGTVYTAKVRASNETGVSEESSVSISTLPGSVTGFQAESIDEDNIVLEWNSVKGAQSYEVDAPQGQISVKTNTLKLPSPGPGILALYGIRAVGITGTNTETTVLQVTGSPKPNHVGTGSVVSAMMVTDRSARLAWHHFSGAVNYRIYAKDNRLIGETSEDYFDVSGLGSSTDYSYYVVAASRENTFSASYPVTFTTKSFTDFGLTIGDVGKYDAILHVTDVPQGSFLSVNEITEKGAIEQYAGEQTDVPLKGLNDSTAYNYEVRVYTQGYKGNIAESKSIQFKTKAKEVTAPNPNNLTLPPVKDNQDQADQNDNNDDAVDVPAQNQNAVKFDDIDHTFSKDAIQALADAGIIKGTSDTIFEPTRGVTRAEFMSMVVRISAQKHMSNTDRSIEMKFGDVSSSDWFMTDLSTAYSQGFVKGMSDEAFVPKLTVTREQAAKMIAGTLPELQSGESHFTDQSTVSEWADAQVKSLSSAGLLLGYPDGEFKPKNSLTRAEAAALLWRFYTK